MRKTLLRLLATTTVAGALLASAATGASALPPGGSGSGAFDTVDGPILWTLYGSPIDFGCAPGQFQEHHGGSVTSGGGGRVFGKYDIYLCVKPDDGTTTGTVTFTSVNGRKVGGVETKFAWSAEVTGRHFAAGAGQPRTLTSSTTSTLTVRVTSGTGPYQTMARGAGVNLVVRMQQGWGNWWPPGYFAAFETVAIG